MKKLIVVAVLVAALAVPAPVFAGGVDVNRLINGLLLVGGATTTVSGIGAIADAGSSPRRVTTVVAGAGLTALGIYRMVQVSRAQKRVEATTQPNADIQSAYNQGRADAEKELKREEELKSLRDEIDRLKRGGGRTDRSEGEESTSSGRPILVNYYLRNNLPESCMVVVGQLDGKDFVVNPGESKRLAARKGAQLTNVRFNSGSEWRDMEEGHDIARAGNSVTFHEPGN